jgi:hypothetical protein
MVHVLMLCREHGPASVELAAGVIDGRAVGFSPGERPGSLRHG